MNSRGTNKNLPKIIVAGISGLVGSHLAHRLDKRLEIVGLSRKPDKYPLMENITPISLDITHEKALTSFLDNSEYDIIINCAALTDVDLCEIDRRLAMKLNTEASAIMAEHCKKRDRLLIHLSTDYIFDGKAGPYSEESIPNPINYYGQTKLWAEEAIVSSGCDYIIVRTNHIYGNLPDGPSRLVRWVLQAETQRIKAAGDQYNNSTWAGNLADCIIELVDGDFRGVVNVGGPDYLSRYEFAIRGAEIFGFGSDNIIKARIDELGMTAPRPLKAGLTIAKMKKIFKTAPVSVLDGLKNAHDGTL
jgi:dTDP-4-dehydrorhamnose reductase